MSAPMGAGKAAAVGVRDTLAFVVAATTASTRLLEVGCGDGALGEELVAAGYQWIGVDAAEDAVERARRRGLDAHLADWPDFDAVPVDAILFTRSLHHVRELGSALDRARDLLVPGGLLVVEDFAYSDASQYAMRWLQRLAAILREVGLLDPGEGTLLHRMLTLGDVTVAWDHDHAHDLHTAAAMESAIRQRFDITSSKRAPYLYRYLADELAGDQRGAQVIEQILAHERKTGESVLELWIGRRWVARG